eukprot:1230478-Pyramimonas_sp.AAC.1
MHDVCEDGDRSIQSETPICESVAGLGDSVLRVPLTLRGSYGNDKGCNAPMLPPTPSVSSSAFCRISWRSR